MTEVESVTRVLFEDFTPSAVGLFYAVGFAAIALFFFGVYVQVRKYRRGAAANLGGNLSARLWAMIGTVLSHRTVARRDRPAGAAHRLIFYGFLRPPKLDYARPDRQPGDPDYDRSGYRREDWAFLWTLLVIVATGYLLEA